MPTTPSQLTPGTDQRRPRRRWLKVFFILLILLALAVTGAVVWGTHRYQDLVALGQQAREGVAAVNQSFPFQPPPPGESGDAPRWAAMLRVRERLLNSLTPEIKAGLDNTLGAAKLSRLELVWRLMAVSSALGGLMREQLDALRREKMSPEEYTWRLGLAMREAMGAPDPSDPSEAGAGYWRVIRQFERLSQSARETAGKVDAERTYERLKKTYRDYTLGQPDVVRQLRQPNEAAYAVDWLIVAAQWIAPAGKGAAGPGMAKSKPGGKR